MKLLQARPGTAGPLTSGQLFLGKYEVRALLGKGGHAWVYECFDRFLNRAVAVKVIKTLREIGRDLSHRAQSEAQVLAAMTHPNLVRVMDAGTVAGLVYIVMEKLEGRTLRHTLMARSRLPIPEALNIAIQIADGMELAHDKGVIHRDLKPENIFIEAQNQVKVLDFGVARVLGAGPVTTQKDRLQGTVFYMSPEQLQGLPATPASDVFALGTMVYEMLYGHPLLLGGGALPDNEHVAWMQLYRVPPSLETLDQQIPRYVGKLVGRAIVKLPAERFATMRQFRDAAAIALRRFASANTGQESHPAPAPPTQPRPRLAAPLAAAPAAAPQQKASARPVTAPLAPADAPSASTSRARLSKHAIAGFLVGLALIALLLGSRHGETRTSSAIPASVPLPSRSAAMPATQSRRTVTPATVTPTPSGALDPKARAPISTPPPPPPPPSTRATSKAPASARESIRAAAERKPVRKAPPREPIF